MHRKRRRHRVHAHPEQRSFHSRAPSERHHPRLGRRVVGLAALGTPTEHRRVVHHHPGVTRLHVPERRAHTTERPVEGDVKNPHPLLVGHVDEISGPTEPRVVHHDVDLADRSGGSGEHRLHLLFDGHVARQRGRHPVAELFG